MGNRVSNNRVSNNRAGYSRVGNNSRSCSIGRNSIIGDISNISIIVIGVVVDCLGTSIRESHRVGARIGTSTIRALSSLEVRSRVVISYSVVVVVGGDLSKSITSSVTHSMSYRVGNNRAMGHNRGMSHNRGMGKNLWCRGSKTCGQDSCKTDEHLHIGRLRLVGKLVIGLTE